jgi:anti-anti-sigma factor
MGLPADSAGPVKQPLIIRSPHTEWDVSSRSELETLLRPTCDQPSVIIDLTNVIFADSTILSELIRMRTHRATRGFSPPALVIASAALRRLMEIVRFQEIFPMYEDLDSALAATTPGVDPSKTS